MIDNIGTEMMSVRDFLGYLLGSICLAISNFVAGYYLRHNPSLIYKNDLLCESIGIFAVNILACIRYGKRHLGSCLVAAILVGPLLYREALHLNAQPKVK